MRLEAQARTDPGPVRENNEDAFLVEVDAGLFVVADGWNLVIGSLTRSFF